MDTIVIVAKIVVVVGVVVYIYRVKDIGQINLLLIVFYGMPH